MGWSAICDALLNFWEVLKEKTWRRGEGVDKSIFSVTSYVDDPLERMCTNTKKLYWHFVNLKGIENLLEFINLYIVCANNKITFFESFPLLSPNRQRCNDPILFKCVLNISLFAIYHLLEFKISGLVIQASGFQSLKYFFRATIKFNCYLSRWHSKWHILHLTIRVKINIITNGIWPLLTNAKCVTDSFHIKARQVKIFVLKYCHVNDFTPWFGLSWLRF